MSLFRMLAVLAALILALCAGMWLGGHPENLPDDVADVFVDQNTHLQAEATDTIEDKFYKKVSPQKLNDASIKGMTRSLHSRFTEYFTPAQNKLLHEALEGTFSGVGMAVVEHKRGLRVAIVYPDSPAKRAGVKPGDLVTKVDSKSIAGVPSTVATARIKGPAGTKVSLTIVSKGRQRTETLEREAIRVPVVAGRLRNVGGKKLGAIGIASFTRGVHSDVRNEVGKLQKRGAQGFVIDMRGNGGGLLDESVLVSSIFIPSGTIVTTEGRTQPKKTYDAVGPTVTDRPVVVLVNKDTASASEIVAAALQQRYHSKVVGQRTLGKGVFGQVFPLSNGGSLDLVVGTYVTPNGSSIHGKGVKPNVLLSNAVNANPQLALDRALEVLAVQVQRQRK